MFNMRKLSQWVIDGNYRAGMIVLDDSENYLIIWLMIGPVFLAFPIDK